MLVCLIKLVRLRIHSQYRVFPFSCWPREGFRKERRIQTIQRVFIQRAWKQSESLVLRLVPDEEFLHSKINNKDVYLDYGATEDIPEDACSLRQYGGRFGSLVLTCLIFLLLGFGRNARLDFGFPSNFTTSYSK